MGVFLLHFLCLAAAIPGEISSVFSPHFGQEKYQKVASDRRFGSRSIGTKMSCDVPDYIRSELYFGRLHPEIMVDISCNKQCGFYVGMSRTWACYTKGKLDSMMIPDQSFRFVWQLRHLAMRVAYFPGCEKLMTRPRFPVRLRPKFQIPPDVKIGGVMKPAYHYEALQEVEHDTTYTPVDEYVPFRR